MNLNKKIRADIALKLTVKACEDSANTLAADIADLAKKFWARHESEVSVKLSGIPRKRWPQLIQEGVIVGAHRKHPSIPNDKSSYYRDAKLVQPSRFEYEDHPTKIASFTPGMLLRKFPNLDKQIHQHYRTWKIQLIAGATTPDYNTSEQFAADDQLIIEYIALTDRFEQILGEAKSMYIDTLDVLDACRTAKQLETLLPEAAKLVPKPAAKAKNVMPTELAEKIRGKIESGIPTSSAA